MSDSGQAEWGGMSDTAAVINATTNAAETACTMIVGVDRNKANSGTRGKSVVQNHNRHVLAIITSSATIVSRITRSMRFVGDG